MAEKLLFQDILEARMKIPPLPTFVMSPETYTKVMYALLERGADVQVALGLDFERVVIRNNKGKGLLYGAVSAQIFLLWWIPAEIVVEVTNDVEAVLNLENRWRETEEKLFE